MAIIGEIDQDEWNDWVATRPKIIQQLCKELPPNRLFRLGNKRVFVTSYEEDGTVSVQISHEFNPLTIDYGVFGVHPQELNECELPTQDELYGSQFKPMNH